MFPQHILLAANHVERARSAAGKLGATDHVTASLGSAEYLLRECWCFAQAVADAKAIDAEAASRLLSAVLGFEVRCLGASAGLKELEGYNRQAK